MSDEDPIFWTGVWWWNLEDACGTLGDTRRWPGYHVWGTRADRGIKFCMFVSSRLMYHVLYFCIILKNRCIMYCIFVSSCKIDVSCIVSLYHRENIDVSRIMYCIMSESIVCIIGTPVLHGREY